MYRTELPTALSPIAVRRRALPDDLGSEVLRTEDFVHEDASQVADVGRQVQEDRAPVRQQLPEQEHPGVEHLQVALDARAPGVAVRLLLDDRLDLGQALLGRRLADRDADLVVLA